MKISASFSCHLIEIHLAKQLWNVIMYIKIRAPDSFTTLFFLQSHLESWSLQLYVQTVLNHLCSNIAEFLKQILGPSWGWLCTLWQASILSLSLVVSWFGWKGRLLLPHSFSLSGRVNLWSQLLQRVYGAMGPLVTYEPTLDHWILATFRISRMSKRRWSCISFFWSL